MSVILIADDEARIRRLVSDFLKREGHTVLEAGDGEEAHKMIHEAQPKVDLAILDVMMPGLDGFSLLRALRSEEPTSQMPVIMLTARAEDNDQLLGLENGADDYVTKPFSPLVLVARVRNLLGRTNKRPGGSERFGALEINEKRREVKINGESVELTPKEYELLIYFKNNKGIALSRENVLNSVWGYDYFGELRTVDTHVKKLRAKLGSCGTMIETVRGYGYRFEG